MTRPTPRNPLPPCPVTLNCVRTSRVFTAGIEKVFDAVTKIFEAEAHHFEIINPKRIEIHAVYRIPVFGFKDDVEVILEAPEEQTILFIRSASRLGAYDFGMNRRRVKRILKKVARLLA